MFDGCHDLCTQYMSWPWTDSKVLWSDVKQTFKQTNKLLRKVFHGIGFRTTVKHIYGRFFVTYFMIFCFIWMLVSHLTIRLIQSLQCQTCHGCFNHTRLAGLCFECLRRLFYYYIHLRFGKTKITWDTNPGPFKREPSTLPSRSEQ